MQYGDALNTAGNCLSLQFWFLQGPKCEEADKFLYENKVFPDVQAGPYDKGYPRTN
jgi:hypothetical protein